MENQNLNGNAAEIAALKEKMRKIQEEQAKKNVSPKRKGEELLKKFFIPKNPTEMFRILPPKQGRDFYETAFFHEVMVNTPSGYKKKSSIYCPRHNNPKVPRLDVNGNPILDGNGKPIMDYAPCPLCDKYDSIISTQDPSVKFIKKDNMNDYQKKILANNTEILKKANEWKARKFFILKGIDKGQEKDGIKFWRFKETFDGQGVWDKLFPITYLYVNQKNKDFTNEKEGCDLIILSLEKENKRTRKMYPAVSVITASESCPLHGDPHVIQQWLSDTMTWREVFKPKSAPNITPYEYMQMIVNGVDPYWNDVDANNKHWVFPNNPELQSKANTRTQNLDSGAGDKFESASDVSYDYVPPVTISNVTPNNVGTFKDNSLNVGAEVMNNHTEVSNEGEVSGNESDDYDDSELPF
jgi:hypothetical protein